MASQRRLSLKPVGLGITTPASSPCSVKAALQDHARAEVEHAEHVEKLLSRHAVEISKRDAQHAHEREKARVLLLHSETQASIRGRKEELAASHAREDLIAVSIHPRREMFSGMFLEICLWFSGARDSTGAAALLAPARVRTKGAR